MDSRLSLAKIKIVKALSDETPCFAADVLLDHPDWSLSLQQQKYLGIR